MKQILSKYTRHTAHTPTWGNALLCCMGTGFWVFFILILTLPARANANDDDDKPLIVQEIQCIGNRATSCGFIKSKIYLVKGDVLDEEEISNARLRLSTLGNFSSARIFLKKGQMRGRVIVMIEVKETNPYRTEVSSNTFLSDEVSLQRSSGSIAHENLFGRGKTLQIGVVDLRRFDIDARDQNAQSLRFLYFDPNLFGSSQYYFIAGTRSIRVQDRNKEKFNEIGHFNTAFVSFGRRLWDFTYFSLDYRASIWTYKKTGKFDVRRSQEDSRSLGFTYGWNTENDPHFPTEGSSAFIHHQRDVILGNVDFGYRKTWKVGNMRNLALHIGTPPTSGFQDSSNNNRFIKLGYSKDLTISGIKRGRWYIDVGCFSQGVTSRKSCIDLGFGIKLETRKFGLVNLSVTGVPK